MSITQEPQTTIQKMKQWIKNSWCLSTTPLYNVRINYCNLSITLEHNEELNEPFNSLYFYRKKSISIFSNDEYMPYPFDNSIQIFKLQCPQLNSLYNIPKKLDKLILCECDSINIDDINKRNIDYLMLSSIINFDVSKLYQEHKIKTFEIGSVCDDRLYNFDNYNKGLRLEKLLIYAAKRLKNVPLLLTLDIDDIAFLTHSLFPYNAYDLTLLSKIVHKYISKQNKIDHVMDLFLELEENCFNDAI